MPPSPIEQTLRGMIEAEEKRALAETRKAGGARLLPQRKPKSKPAGSVRTRSRRSDLIVATMGLALGLGCALFPWYIFFNQEKFGIRAMKFSGAGEVQAGPIYLGSQGERVGAPMTVDEIPAMKLDLFATGTPKRAPDEGLPAAGMAEQPFPEDWAEFRLVYVSNGRAMIADDTGLWVVQAGSALPDNSQVKKIEQRDGKWVLVTSADRVLELSTR